MPYKCCVSSCKSGYDTQPRSELNLAFHRFPLHDGNLTLNWLKAVNRVNFKPTKHSRVCSLHFTEDDFEWKSLDKRHRTTSLKLHKLKHNATPTKFMQCCNLSKCDCGNNKNFNSNELATSVVQQENNSASSLENVTVLDVSDVIKDYDDLLHRFNNVDDTCGFTKHVNDNSVVFLIINCCEMVPRIQCSVKITKSLKVSVCNDGRLVNRKEYSDLLHNDTVRSFSNAQKLLSFAKSLTETVNTSANVYLDVAKKH